MQVIIYDASSLRYQWDASRTTATVTNAAGEVLASVDCPPGTSDREAAFLAMDGALGGARLRRADAKGAQTYRRVAFYNPFTAQVALGSVPRTQVFADGGALELEASGAEAVIADDALWVGSRVLPVFAPDTAAVATSLAAHRA
jgi:hypothetical protein